MANVLMPSLAACALLFVCAACGSDRASSGDGAPAPPPEGGAVGLEEPEPGATGASSGTGEGGHAGMLTSGGTSKSGAAAAAGAAAASGGGSGGASSEPPPAVDGLSVYALECHGDSKDCNRATVPCFGVASPTPNVAAGWACANRCVTNADCSTASSGTDAQAACVPFSSAGHCMLVCQDEARAFACPDGMGCYVPARSPVGYCLWQ